MRETRHEQYPNIKQSKFKQANNQRLESGSCGLQFVCSLLLATCFLSTLRPEKIMALVTRPAPWADESLAHCTKARSTKPLSKKELPFLSFKPSLFGRLRIEPSFFQLHHKTVFLTSFFKDPHRFFKIMRIHYLNFNHSLFTAFI